GQAAGLEDEIAGLPAAGEGGEALDDEDLAAQGVVALELGGCLGGLAVVAGLGAGDGAELDAEVADDGGLAAAEDLDGVDEQLGRDAVLGDAVIFAVLIGEAGPQGEHAGLAVDDGAAEGGGGAGEGDPLEVHGAEPGRPRQREVDGLDGGDG